MRVAAKCQSHFIRVEWKNNLMLLTRESGVLITERNAVQDIHELDGVV